jgi:hypothetical protein
MTRWSRIEAGPAQGRCERLVSRPGSPSSRLRPGQSRLCLGPEVRLINLSHSHDHGLGAPEPSPDRTAADAGLGPALAEYTGPVAVTVRRARRPLAGVAFVSREAAVVHGTVIAARAGLGRATVAGAAALPVLTASHATARYTPAAPFTEAWILFTDGSVTIGIRAAQRGHRGGVWLRLLGGVADPAARDGARVGAHGPRFAVVVVSTCADR